MNPSNHNYIRHCLVHCTFDTGFRVFDYCIILVMLTIVQLWKMPTLSETKYSRQTCDQSIFRQQQRDRLLFLQPTPDSKQRQIPCWVRSQTPFNILNRCCKHYMKQNQAFKRVTSLSVKAAKFAPEIEQSSKIHPGFAEQSVNHTEHHMKSFETILTRLEDALEKQNYKMLQFQSNVTDNLISRFDKLISINERISEGISRLTNSKQPQDCSPVISPRLQGFFKDKGGEVSLKQSIIGLNKLIPTDSLEKAGSILPPLPSLDQSIIIPISKSIITRKNTLVENPTRSLMMFTKAQSTNSNNSVQEMAVALFNTTTETEQNAKISEWVGNFYNCTACYYFDQYSTGKINYQDMKIKFCGDILNELLNLSYKWEQLNGVYGKPQMVVSRRNRFYHGYNQASRRTLQFLITKYPPSRRKVIDSELSEKIKQVKNVDIIKHDILRNASLEIGLDHKQTDFTKEIKILLNKLIVETNKEFPAFKKVMKAIFVKTEMEVRVDSQVEFIIGRKIAEGTSLYSAQELEVPGLELKSPQLLRILVKWCEELLSYFLNPQEKIYGNKFGFKNIKPGALPIKILRSRLQELVNNLKRIFQEQVKPIQKQEYNNIGNLIMDLINISLDGVSGYEFLNEREIVINKLSEYFNDSLKSYVLVFINLMLNKLVKVRTLYEDQKLESNMNLITFGVMDLIRCRCTGSKADIYRIYNEIVDKKDYFQVIRIKNKLNEATRDILINLKLKNSFLICEVQLSLGETQQEVNDHFCHFLYELERTSFGVLFECASQISSLDPKMNYIKHQKALVFKGSSKRKTDIIKSIKTVDDQRGVCSMGHPQTLMDTISNNRPFCCSLCTKFIPSYTLCLDLFRCSVCSVTLCPECIIMMNRSNKVFIQKYTYLNEECDDTNEFFYTKHLYQGMCESDKVRSKLPTYIQQYQYILHVVANNIGYKRTIYKRYKNSFTQAFSTLPQLNKHSSSKLCWNYIQALKPFSRKYLNELNDYRKFHISLEWSSLEEILEEHKLVQVVCVIDNDNKSALIVDILETEEEIERFKLQHQVDLIIDEVNTNRQTSVELTSKKMQSIDIIGKVEDKQAIKIVNIWENKIKNIDILHQFPRVQELFLRQNHIESLESVLNMNDLQLAFVSDNKIKGSLPVLNFPLLCALDISLNLIADIDNLASSPLNSLVFFRMVSTKVKSIPVMTLPKLEVFWFDHNDITNVQNLFNSHLPELTKVSGTHNLITGGLPELHYNKLENLILSYNQIDSVQDLCRSRCPKLRTLCIHHNSISGSLPSMTFPSLVKLDLSYNKIVEIPQEVFTSVQFKCLQVLDLKCNQIHGNLPTLDLPSVKKIDLSNNLIDNIQALGRSKLPLLVILDISKNMVKGSIPCLRILRLKEINLSNNQIVSLANLAESKLPGLVVMRCDYNRICCPVPRMYMQSLRVLQLSNNSIPSQEFMRHIHLLPSLKRVYVKDNPESLALSLNEQCDEHTIQLLEFKDHYLGC